jgi:hypothetical protein
MEASNSKDMTLPESSPEEQLSALFGSYKAEWLRDQIFDLFTEPSYFPEMTTSRPCMLIGGRGTGKTTVLRCLSYEGRFALQGRRVAEIPAWPYYGVYYRVNTNRVTAFKGPELDGDHWRRTFAHYFNLLLCELTVDFLEWFRTKCPDQPTLTSRHCARIGVSLHLGPTSDASALADALQDARLAFEAYINNVADRHAPALSLQGSPIDVLTEAMQEISPFAKKPVFYLLDEYENLEDYQQQVINTLIKHSGQHYTFKIGIRELGWRCRTTVNENEQLIHPADYVRIDITDKLEGDVFKSFALKVCNDRLGKLRLASPAVLPSVELLLPGLSEDAEAKRLGIEEAADQITAELQQEVPHEQLSTLATMTPLERFFLGFTAAGRGAPVSAAYAEYVSDPITWKTSFENYKHALLYTIRRGKRGIQKYYAGWNVFTLLAASNIRYLLALVEQSCVFHLRSQRGLVEPIDAGTQTRAAQYVGKQNLSELEGLSVDGAQLTKLLLGLGRVFQRMASDAVGHAPEVTHFHISDVGVIEDASAEKGSQPEVLRLLRSAVMHLALLRSPGNKPGAAGETKDYDYRVHPIYCAFFSFSYRKKRKMRLSADQIIGLVNKPAKTIREILEQNNRTAEEALPEQLELFERFFHGD